MSNTVEPTPSQTPGSNPSSPMIHPIIVFPYVCPEDFSDLEALYTWVEGLALDEDTYARPITVIDRKTHLASKEKQLYSRFREGKLADCSEIVDAWCVDTCQMWYTGLGRAFEEGKEDDVYWLIPGDFNYGTTTGTEVLGRLHDLPEIVLELNQDLCVGEIATDQNNSKQLIDTYGTFALLYTWFPKEARLIREFTERPRSEFFAVRHSFLREILSQRWYPYEQTMVMLLQAMFSDKRIARFFVGNISDLPGGKDTIAAAIQQVERTERVLKSLWRERHESEPGWIERYRALEVGSEQVRRTALTVLQNLLA